MDLTAPALRTLGSTLFVLGSILFLPAMGEQAYLIGAVSYLLGSVGFLAASLREDWRAGFVGLSTLGSVLFVVGSIACLPAFVAANPYLCLVLFVLGCAAVLAGIGWPTRANRGSALGSAVFIAGCGLALPEVGLYTAAAGLFIVGSLGFLLDGVLEAGAPLLWGAPSR